MRQILQAALVAMLVGSLSLAAGAVAETPRSAFSPPLDAGAALP